MIPFNRQNLFGKELEYIKDAYNSGKVSGDGNTQKCVLDLWRKDLTQRRYC